MGIRIIIGGNNYYLNSVVSLALKVYKSSDVSSVETYREYFKKCPNAFIFAVNDITEELIGYTINLPLLSDYFIETVDPKYDESTLTPEKVSTFNLGTNYIYLFSIVIDPDYENRVMVLKMITKATKNQFTEMAKQGIYVTQASAIALSDSGAKICEGMNMKLLGHNHKGLVYWNKEFHKLWNNEDTKEHILKTFILNRKLGRQNG